MLKDQIASKAGVELLVKIAKSTGYTDLGVDCMLKRYGIDGLNKIPKHMLDILFELAEDPEYAKALNKGINPNQPHNPAFTDEGFVELKRLEEEAVRVFNGRITSQAVDEPAVDYPKGPGPKPVQYFDTCQTCKAVGKEQDHGGLEECPVYRDGLLTGTGEYTLPARGVETLEPVEAWEYPRYFHCDSCFDKGWRFYIDGRDNCRECNGALGPARFVRYAFDGKLYSLEEASK